MKVEIAKEKILGAVGHAERIAGKHVSLPVLSCIVLEAKKDELVVKATNLDVGIEINLPAKVLSEGVVALSPSLLKSFLSNSDSEKGITFELVEGTLKVNAGGSKASIKTMNAEDFPAIPRVVSEKKFSLPTKDFVTGVNSVWYSASLGSLKPELSSVYIFPSNEDLVFVSTDSFRLAEKRIKAKKAKDADPMLVPFKNISEIARVFGNISGDVDIVSDKNQVSFFVPGIHITSRVVDGNFPDYRQIIPKEFISSATVLKDDFAKALKLTGTFSDSFNQLIFSLSVSGKSLEIKTKNNDVGEGEETIKGSVSGENLTITFNHKYISDCLQSIDSESLTLQFSGQGKALVITPAHNASFMYLVMPMNR